MSTDVTEPQPPPAVSSEDAEALLDSANSASQHVAVLHVAFMALCAYVLVIVFGTTDMDLLIGKGVKLPVVDVTVPIVGFYAFAPYLVVLVHFNLLLQLQLLSRQLYNFDTVVAKEDERLGGLRDRLHIFPYTYYLVGRPGPIVRRLLGVVVGITLLVLPIATLLVLQLRFLAYQDQAVTWAQRVAVWLDVALVIALWPVIMDRGDSWRAYLRRLISRVRQRWIMGLLWAAAWVAVIVLCFAKTLGTYLAAQNVIVALLILFVVLEVLGVLARWSVLRLEPRGANALAELSPGMPWPPPRSLGRDPPVASSQAALRVRGMPGFLLVVALGAPLPVALLVDGEWWEEKVLAGEVVASNAVYDGFRHLDLTEQVLLAKPAKPEVVARFREGAVETLAEALTHVEGVKLSGRSLWGAQFVRALLPGADLRGAQLQRAVLLGASLQGAQLTQANLEGANLTGTQLQGANLLRAHMGSTDLEAAQLHGVNLREAQLQRANFRRADLMGAQLQGANLLEANLQGADFRTSQLQGASLLGAQLHGANLERADLQGADLRAMLQGTHLFGALLDGADLAGAYLWGANLQQAQLQGANMVGAELRGADLTGAQLRGADLQYAELYGAIVMKSSTALVELRVTRWTPLREEQLAETRKVMGEIIADAGMIRAALARIQRAVEPGLVPPILQSCLVQPEVAPELNCEQKWLPDDLETFRRELFPVLEKLACQSSWIAGGLIRQIPRSHPTGGRFGLAGRFAVLLDNPECEGLSSLPEAEKDQIHELAKKEKEERRRQSAAGKPAEEVPASPNPAPAIAPETP